MKDISIVLAFSAGLLSFLSPCVLPLVPAYVSYLTGAAIQDLSQGKAKLYTLYKAIGFTLGFSIIFIIMGLSITTLGKYFDKYQDYIRIIGGILVIVFGLHITGLVKIKYFYYEKRLTEPGKLGSGASSILLGMAFATGWTPCIGPILASILIYAGSMSTIYKGVLLLIAYSIGLALPFIFTALAIESFSKYFRRISKYMPIISAISGFLVIGVGLIILFDKFLRFSSYFNFFNF
ncbi:MAG TPA: cytochrome c biogenesis protein CcdA [Patescibacteria group bacterium]|nr:cytochrome c biogenesis protein CcdA [Patescibacteria group bacterium]